MPQLLGLPLFSTIISDVCRPKSAIKTSGIRAFLASCPENAFQRVPQGYSPFTVAQRAGAVVRNGTKLLAVGFGASLFGVSITNVLIAVRQQLDPTWVPLNSPQVKASTDASIPFARK